MDSIQDISYIFKNQTAPQKKQLHDLSTILQDYVEFLMRCWRSSVGPNTSTPWLLKASAITNTG